jgi:hypothetical protein
MPWLHFWTGRSIIQWKGGIVSEKNENGSSSLVMVPTSLQHLRAYLASSSCNEPSSKNLGAADVREIMVSSDQHMHELTESN